MRQAVRDRLIAADGLRRMREEAGLSLSKAADSSGVPRWRIQRIETGLAQPTFSDVLDLCAACGCKLEKLLDKAGLALLTSVTLADCKSSAGAAVESSGRSRSNLAGLRGLIEKSSEVRANVIDICWWYYRMRQSLNGLEIPALNTAGAEELHRHAMHAAGLDAAVCGKLAQLIELHSAL